MFTLRRAFVISAFAVLACTNPDVTPSGSGGAGGFMVPGQGGAGGAGGIGDIGAVPGSNGGGGTGGAPTGMGMDKCGKLVAVVRDFQDSHPDFEAFLGDVKNIVRNELGADGLPVYAEENAATISRVTSGKANFDQWYRDVAGVNMKIEVDLPLSPLGTGTFFFESDAPEKQFFPFDNKGFGNMGRTHNYHFTTHVAASFKYRGGERFKFRGDDDLWIFVNRKLALDLGGVHGAQEGEIDFDAKAAELGITKGNVYTFDIFHAERHTAHSNFRVETSIDCLQRRIE